MKSRRVRFEVLSWFIASFATFWIAACTQKPSAGGSAESASVSIPTIEPREALGLLNNDFAILVDVREEEEIKNTGMAASARSMPFSKVQAESPEWKAFLSGLPQGKQIIFYCAKGGRAEEVAKKAALQGFRVGNLGGFSSWKDAGLPVRASP